MNEVNMMTRSGKKNDCNEVAEDGEGATADPVAKAGAKPGDKLDELTALVKSLMQSQATRDQRMDKESAQQEQRWKSMQHQFQQIQVQVKEMTEQQQEQEDNQIEEGGEPDEGPSLTGQQMWSLPRQEPFHQRDPKLLPLTPDDDIEHFLTTFERMAQVCRWPREEWAVRLVPLLTGKARSAYVHMDIADSEVYDKVKDAILAKYEITADTYRRRFRALDIHPGETPRELYVRLKDTFYKWAKPEKSTVKDISELMILEQFLRMVHPDLEVWIRERAPKSAEEASQLAEIFISARTGSRGITFGRDSFVTGQNISSLQQADPSLKSWFDKVSEVDGQVQGKVDVLADATYVLRKGVLYECKGKTEAIALPQAPRHKVMELGHSVPWAGHLGFHKSLHRIASRFVWPGMYTQLQQFCKSCQICQLTLNKGVARAHLQPLPVIDTPFERIGMDVVGPLERSSSGNRYILVICDYATRYPEAFPLRSAKARQVSNCLLQLFSRVGIAKEVLTDCGTNFQSKFLQQVYRLLGIKGIKTTPYHPQSDGLVERFNQTLKNMLRKFVTETGSDWDQWLPYLLFAYREVPQASTGFSPFELLYGRQVRGPLDLLKEQWENPEPDGDNVIAYVLKMRERLEQMTILAQHNMKVAQDKQKTWYDKKARERTLQPGQQVLLLLPTTDSKLLARWQGPYKITKRLSNVNYELYMPDRRKKHQVFHINLLKEFMQQQPTTQQQHQQQQPTTQQQLPMQSMQQVKQHCLVRAVKDEEEGEQFFPTGKSGPSLVSLTHLKPSQQGDLRALLDPNLFQEKPGFTKLVQHKVHLRDNAPPRRKFYRIPERLVPQLKKEIDLMLSLGIIETSASEWCSPIVLVPKKDGTLRFCIDLRYLNSVSKFDPYPMPRIDELLERVGRSKFITTLDLSKGYWQLALAPEAKELTAFKTPFGLFQFRVMPFGLQGAPATFQDFAAAYLDDVVIFSQTWEQHVAHLRRVLKLIKSAGLTINPHKCKIAQTQVEYLGYVVGHGQVKPQVGKMEAIHAYPVPTTKKKVRAFTGLVGWYSKFIPHFAERAAPLTDLTKASAPHKVKWTKDCDRAFIDLKSAITSDSVLHSLDFTQPFTLQTDASGVGIGAVLLQEVEGVRRPVVFLSRKLQDRESRYSTVEKECLAMKWAVESLRYYLLGRHFTLETDHRALQWLHKMKETNMRVARWYLSLQPYDFTVQYRPGKSNCVQTVFHVCMKIEVQ
ncbi:hypothetical protein ACER0C_001329 [Sarotherodon galilaeus]